MSVHQLIVDNRDGLLSGDPSSRQKSLGVLIDYLNGIDAANIDQVSLDYLFEFLICRVKSGDCLDESAKIITFILRASISDRKSDFIKDLISAFSSPLPVESRLCIFKLLNGLLCPSSLLDFLSVVKGEKDPRCLTLIFDLVTNCSRTLDAGCIEEVFEAFSVYFPISFRSSLANNPNEEELREKLRGVLSSHPDMAHLSLPFFNDKLASSSSSSVISESIKALKACYKHSTESACQAYFKESINLLITCLGNLGSDKELSFVIFDFLAGAFFDSAVYDEVLNLISDHILHSLEDNNSTIYNHLPSLIRFVAAPTLTASRMLSSRLLSPISDAIERNIAKMEWACLLGFLCAFSESQHYIFREQNPFIIKCVQLQTELLTGNAAQKEVLFAISFIEALLRDSLLFGNEILRISLIMQVFDAIERFGHDMDSGFASMISLSVVKHQKATLMNHAEQLAKYSSLLVIKALLADPELFSLVITATIVENGVNLGLFVAESNLADIPEHVRIRWIELLDKLDNESCLDRIICSLDPNILLSHVAGMSKSTIALIYLSLPPELSSIDLLAQFAHIPEIVSAMFNKHQACLEDLQVNDEMTQFCVVRAMIFQQDCRSFEYIKEWPINKSKLLDSSYSRVNESHRFVMKPFYEQWFMESVICKHHDLFGTDCTVELLCSCSISTIQALNLSKVLDECLDSSATPNVIKLLVMILATDAFILKSHFKQVVESLVSCAVKNEISAVRHAALQCLQSLLEIISGSAVLPFIPYFVCLLKPALGDKKAAVRALAVHCTNQLYSFHI